LKRAARTGSDHETVSVSRIMEMDTRQSVRVRACAQGLVVR